MDGIAREETVNLRLRIDDIMSEGSDDKASHLHTSLTLISDRSLCPFLFVSSATNSAANVIPPANLEDFLGACPQRPWHGTGVGESDWGCQLE